MISSVFIVATMGYLLGSFPTGFLVGRFAHVDVRAAGSGNIGATNVVRLLGKRFGYAVFLVDALKGILAVRAAIFVGERMGYRGEPLEICAIIAAISCVVGHSFPIWLRFKGGKGAATSSGVVIALMPLVAAVGLIVWVIAFETTRYVSVASVAAATTLPVTVAIFSWAGIIMHGAALFYFSIAIAAIIVWRHRSNFSRLMNGTEPRFTRK
ncbi:MAG: acyl phosphate:glycerol-3-phosphate acyltransferase [Verrucomicrobiota bacterium]|jgi:glycerol-3-phosphate acyltransferase PlsY